MDIATSTNWFPTYDPTWIWLRYRMIPQMPGANRIFLLLLQSAVVIILCGGCRTELARRKNCRKVGRHVWDCVRMSPPSPSVADKNKLQYDGAKAGCKVFGLFFKHDIYQSNLKLHRLEPCMLITSNYITPRYWKSWQSSPTWHSPLGPKVRSWISRAFWVLGASSVCLMTVQKCRMPKDAVAVLLPLAKHVTTIISKWASPKVYGRVATFLYLANDSMTSNDRISALSAVSQWLQCPVDEELPASQAGIRRRRRS